MLRKLLVVVALALASLAATTTTALAANTMNCTLRSANVMLHRDPAFPAPTGKFWALDGVESCDAAGIPQQLQYVYYSFRLTSGDGAYVGSWTAGGGYTGALISTIHWSDEVPVSCPLSTAKNWSIEVTYNVTSWQGKHWNGAFTHETGALVACTPSSSW